MSDLTYSVVKAYAKKGSLLSRAELENLAESKNLDELVNRLRATSYNDEVGKIDKLSGWINSISIMLSKQALPSWIKTE